MGTRRGEPNVEGIVAGLGAERRREVELAGQLDRTAELCVAWLEAEGGLELEREEEANE